MAKLYRWHCLSILEGECEWRGKVYLSHRTGKYHWTGCTQSVDAIPPLCSFCPISKRGFFGSDSESVVGTYRVTKSPQQAPLPHPAWLKITTTGKLSVLPWWNQNNSTSSSDSRGALLNIKCVKHYTNIIMIMRKHTLCLGTYSVVQDIRQVNV